MGDISNTNLWRHAFTFVAFDADGASLPSTIDDPFGSDWDDLGILVKGGPSESRAWGQDTPTFGRNGELLDRYVDELAVTFNFSVHEDNEVTEALRGIEGGIEYGVEPLKVKLGFELRNRGRKRRKITSAHALVVQSGDIAYPENAVTAYSFTATVFPDLDVTNADGAPAYWVVQSTDDSSSS